MIYVAMFEEVNEGTAIFKCADNPPICKIAKFVGMDGMPSYHYLWLTGKATEFLKSGKVFPTELPLRMSKYNVNFSSDINYSTFTLNLLIFKNCLMYY